MQDNMNPLAFPQFVFGEFASQRATNNRYTIDSDVYWKPQYHPRVRDLPSIDNFINTIVTQRVNNGQWVFPVDEQSEPANDVFKQTLQTFSSDYLNMVRLRRLSRRPDNVDNITLDDIQNEYAYTFIANLWDIATQVLISSYPLVADDLRVRSGKTNHGDRLTTDHDNTSRAEQQNTTEADHNSTSQARQTNLTKSNHESTSQARQTNTSEATHDNTSMAQSGSTNITNQENIQRSTIDNRNIAKTTDNDTVETSGTNSVTDLFLSPQDQGIAPQASVKVDNNEIKSPIISDSDGANNVEFDSDDTFTTNTTRTVGGATSKNTNNTLETELNAYSEGMENDTLGTTATKTDDLQATQDLNTKQTAQGETQGQHVLGSIASQEGETQGGHNLGSKTTQIGTTKADQHVGTVAVKLSDLTRQESLDMANVLQQYMNLNATRLMLEMDNRMLSLYLLGSFAQSPSMIDYGARTGQVF